MTRDESARFLFSLCKKQPEQLSYPEFLELVLPNSRMKARQKALQRARRASQNLDLETNEILSDSANNAAVISLSAKVNFSLVQVIDHEIRLFREIE